jgi:hypothetical protein
MWVKNPESPFTTANAVFQAEITHSKKKQRAEPKETDLKEEKTNFATPGMKK